MSDRSRRLALAVAFAFAFLAGYHVSRVVDPPFHLLWKGESLLQAVASVPSPAVVQEPPLPPSQAPLGLPSCGDDREQHGADVFVIVEQMPELIGGLDAIHAGLSYPLLARLDQAEGRVIVQFVVDACGWVRAPQVVRGVHPALDDEALRVVQAARFRPGVQRGWPVPVQMTLPVTFRLPG